jgi:hypothetical protein
MDLRRSVNTKIWCDQWFESISVEEKLLWLYLLTNQYTNMVGVYEITLKRISFETSIPFGSLSKAFEGFERLNKAFFIENHIVIINWIKNQSMNDNMKKACLDQWTKVPLNVKKALFVKGIESFESLSKGLVTLPKKEKEKEIEIENEIETEKGKIVSDFSMSVCDLVEQKELVLEKARFLIDDILPDQFEKEKKVAPKKEKETGPISNPPDLIQFLEYAQNWLSENNLNFESYRTGLIAKYNQWSEDNWKDGHGKPIKNWKTKTQNAIQYLKPINNAKYLTNHRHISEPQRGKGFGSL